ncbi:MAG: hypothetical protein H6581_24135 [Bacteroidia bacterium]|nr:hypothetical protein [Bacteroidia bacterium]
MIVIPIAVYLIFCVLVALVGSNRVIGFWVALVLCTLFTPLLVGILLLITSPKS